MAIPIAAIMAIVSAASSIMGGMKRNQSIEAQKNAQRQYYERQSGLGKMYLDEYNKDFFDTALARSTLGKMDKKYKEMESNINANSAFTGATHEQKLASKQQLNSQYDDQVKNLAGLATQYKQNALGNYAKIMSGANATGLELGDKLAAFYDTSAQQFGNTTSNALSGLSGALQNIAGSSGGAKSAPAQTNNPNYSGYFGDNRTNSFGVDTSFADNYKNTWWR